MNDPRLVELLTAAATAKACSLRLAPYQKLAAEGGLVPSAIAKDDALWLLAVAKTATHRDLLKNIAKGHPALSLVKD